LAVIITALLIATASCEREPELHLHRGGTVEFEIPFISLDLQTYWNYELTYGIVYDWQNQWYYGWDKVDQQIFGELGYTEPNTFNLRRYYTQNKPYAPHTRVLANTVTGHSFQGLYDWGYWDLLVWNDVKTMDGIQSLLFDEVTTLDYVTAYTNQTMMSSRYQAPKYTRSFYEPEALFSAYEQAIEVNENLDGFEFDSTRNVWIKRLNMELLPITYIYLTQVILHHNNNKITGVDGSANISGMARTVNINTRVAGPDAITVHYNVRFKNNCDMNGESVDIAGGRLMTFGICNLDPNKMSRADAEQDEVNHYIDVTMQFNNGIDSTFVFDVTSQVRKLYKGGVITVELDMDTIPVPARSGGSAFDAVVKDFEDGGTHEFEM